ncbi:hypothetical protein EAY42_24275, partial [Vibrio anguillarum]|nr:hypothetical protein [Vibrio anguillarum]
MGEDKSLVFQASKDNKWPTIKLSKVMRSKNTAMESINYNMLSWIDKFKAYHVSCNSFHLGYPYNLVSDGPLYTENLSEFYND